MRLGFYFADLIFVVCQSTAKIGSLENFRLYGNITVLQSKSVDFFIKLHADLFTCTINKNGSYMD